MVQWYRPQWESVKDEICEERLPMKYCPYCGAEILSGAFSFCPECGGSLSVLEESQTSTEAPPAQKQGKEPRPRKPRKSKHPKEEKPRRTVA